MSHAAAAVSPATRERNLPYVIPSDATRYARAIELHLSRGDFRQARVTLDQAEQVMIRRGARGIAAGLPDHVPAAEWTTDALARCREQLARGEPLAVADLPIDARTLAALEARNILHVAQLGTFTANELIQMPHVGPGRARELLSVLRDLGVELPRRSQQTRASRLGALRLLLDNRSALARVPVDELLLSRSVVDELVAAGVDSLAKLIDLASRRPDCWESLGPACRAAVVLLVAELGIG